MIGGLFNRLRTVSEVDGLTPIQRFGAGLDALILPEMRMGQQIRQQGQQQLASLRRNSTIQELEKRANEGDAVAQRYLQGIQSGAIDPKSGFSGYLNEVAANERMQREINARAALAAAKPPTLSGVEREFNFYKSRGMSDEQALALATRSDAPNVTVNTGDADGLRKELRKKIGGNFSKFQEAGFQAQVQIADLNALDALIKGTPNDKVAGYLAVQFPNLQNDATMMSQAIINRLAPQLRVEGSGSTSDKEYEGMLQGFGKMTQSQAGRAAIYDIFRKRADFLAKRGEIINRFMAGEIETETQLFKELNDLKIENANLSKVMNQYANQFDIDLQGTTSANNIGYKIVDQ